MGTTGVTTADSPFAGRFVGQRECAVCLFTGPETEFIAFGHYPDGTSLLVHRDDAPEGFVLICCGCAALVGRLAPDAIADAIRTLLDREASCQ